MSLTRRTFLRRSAATAAVIGMPALLRGADRNSLLQIAVVGCNGQGFSDLNATGSHERVKFVGFCDVDTARFAQADKKHPGVEHFQDWREMFSKLGDRCDAVMVATPDHTHAIIALAAMRAGKHVYCQKPLTHTVWEARQMKLQAEKSKVITQMGNQIHSAKEYRTAVKLVQDGVIGKVKEVHSWQGNPGNKYSGLTSAPAAGEAPETLDWDLWVGPAPMRAYAPNVYHPFKWRDWQDFGSGTLGDFGCHILDPVFTALELTAPVSVRAENTGIGDETWPEAETVRYVFPGTKWTAGHQLPLTWYDGGRQPDRALAQMPDGEKLPGSGSLLIGEGGVLLVPHVKKPSLYPLEKFADHVVEEVKGASHYHRWVDGIIAHERTSDGFHYAGPLAEAVQLGNVATRFPNETLQWEAPSLRIPNKREAEKLLTKEYRDGWRIDAVI